MKAGILYNDQDIRVGEAPDPVPGPDDVLVEARSASICGTDLHIYRGEFKNRVSYPAILGHEFAGVILQVGKNVKGYKVGDPVVIDPNISCHSCTACQTGHLNACRSLKLLGIDLDGGFGQYVNVPANRVHLLPENVSMAYGSMAEMYALGNHILQRGHVQPGESIVILGAGKLGLSILDVLCHSVSPSTAIVTDLQPFRLDIAAKLGAEMVVDITRGDPVARVLELTRGEGVDCVIEAVGHYHLAPGQEAPLAQAVKMIRNGGRIVTAGLGDQLSAVHFKTLVIKEAEIIASRISLGDFPRALRLLAKGLLHPDLLVTEWLPMREIETAFNKVDREDAQTIKIVLDVQQV